MQATSFSKLLLALVVACSTTACKKDSSRDRPPHSDSQKPERQDPTKQASDSENQASAGVRDQDYFSMLEHSYELDGVLAALNYWLDCRTAAFDDLRGPEARQILVDALNPKKESLKAAILTRQRSFVDRYRIDMKQWRPDFEKRYPDRQLVHEEASEAARVYCRAKSLEISRHLVLELPPNGPKLGEKSWDEYRTAYLVKVAPKFAAEVVDCVRGLDSFQKMKAKIAEAK